ncbi:hypothetical protein CEXT_168011 [Caerostris extrusa]|uniref:Uncharacterized protein n=1 Tax=Caerostris extrusa TaxID=172846 RepID=A0AAV4VU80_CAEEX|nr:hypothetical protein CEXT_168011 [Caerostris extrusa]
MFNHPCVLQGFVINNCITCSDVTDNDRTYTRMTPFRPIAASTSVKSAVLNVFVIFLALPSSQACKRCPKWSRIQNVGPYAYTLLQG